MTALCHFLVSQFLLVVALVLGRRVLVLLVLGDEVVHVGLCLGELHLVHALARVPVKESLAAEHGRELLRDSFEQLLDGRAVANERGGHLQTSRRDVADGRLHVVWNPLDEVAAVLVLNVQHLLVNLQPWNANIQLVINSLGAIFPDNNFPRLFHDNSRLLT